MGSGSFPESEGVELVSPQSERVELVSPQPERVGMGLNSQFIDSTTYIDFDYIVTAVRCAKIGDDVKIGDDITIRDYVM